MNKEDWQDLFVALVDSLIKIEEKLESIREQIEIADNYGVLSSIRENLEKIASKD